MRKRSAQGSHLQSSKEAQTCTSEERPCLVIVSRKILIETQMLICSPVQSFLGVLRSIYMLIHLFEKCPEGLSFEEKQSSLRS